MSYRDIDMTIAEGAQSIIDCGLIKRKQKKSKNGGRTDETAVDTSQAKDKK